MILTNAFQEHCKERSIEMKHWIKCMCYSVLLTAQIQARTMDGVIDLTTGAGSGSKILAHFSGNPNHQGVFAEYELKLPPYQHGLFYVSSGWPRGAGRLGVKAFTSAGEVKKIRGGLMLVLRLENGRHMAFLPLASELAYSWLSGFGDTLKLELGTHGKDPLAGDIPLYVYATGHSPYEAVATVWEMARQMPGVKGNFRLREEKEYFEQLKYPGWMSWGAYAGSINEEKMLATVEQIDRSEVPFRWIIMDAGHYDLNSGYPLKDKFPNGYKIIKDAYAKNGKLRWFTPWYSFCIGKRLTFAPGNYPASLKPYLREVNGVILPKEDLESSVKWWEHIADIAKLEKCDSFKIDFHGFEICAAGGWDDIAENGPKIPPDNSHAVGNPYRTGFLLNKAIEIVSRERNLPLFQCNWTSAPGLFNSYQSVVNRCTGDYFSPDMDRNKVHHKTKSFTHAGYQAALLTGSLVWPDHDEYNPDNALTRRIDTVRRALSGGGMVAYRIPEKLHPEIAALFYADGEIIRPLAPGVLTEDCLFTDGKTIGILKARSPLANRTAVFHVVNIDGPASNPGRRLETVVTVDNYRNASGLMQPYNGEWPVPEEGLYIYDNFSGTGQLMPKEGCPVVIEGFCDALLQVSPIMNGWSVIGRTDKYLSAAVVEILENSMQTLCIKLLEAGPFAVYSSHKAPTCRGITFVDKGNSLYQAELPVGRKNLVLTLKR